MKDLELNKIYQGDSLEVLKTFPDKSVDCVVTSPPYWSLRNYGVDGQLGLESHYREYISKLCDIFDEVHRVLKETGTIWVNLGDSYSGNSGGGPQSYERKSRGIKWNEESVKNPRAKFKETVQPKCLLMIPSRFAIEMLDRGWILRNEIIWHKPSCMPESVKDRFTVDFEKIYFFTKNTKYNFTQQLEPIKDISITRSKYGWHGTKTPHGDNYKGLSGTDAMGERYANPKGRNKRCVWAVTNKGFKGKHYATYPEKLIEPAILGGCPEGGVVLDVFMGAGTTGVVAKKHGRNYVGIELNPEYIKIAEDRINEILI